MTNVGFVIHIMTSIYKYIPISGHNIKDWKSRKSENSSSSYQSNILMDAMIRKLAVHQISLFPW